jgi:hypothetical protein
MKIDARPLAAALLLLSALLLASGGTPARAADEEPAPVKKTKQLIDDESKTILRAAHPLGKLKEAKYDDVAHKDKAYELAYTFRWLGKEGDKEKEFTTKLAFLVEYDKNDDIDKLTIDVKDDTSPAKPFSGADLSAVVLRGLVKKRLKELEVKDEEVLKSLDKLDAKGLLEVWLKYKQRAKG